MFEEMEAKRIRNAQNSANNANMVKNLVDVASKTSDPTVKAIGTGIKAADKLTGGKASEKLGNNLTRANKFNPQGRMLQKASNRLAQSGMGDKLSKSLSQRGNSLNKNTPSKLSSKNLFSNKLKSNNMFDSDSKKETEEQASDGGLANYTVSTKIIKAGLIAFIPVCIFAVFLCVFSAASQIFYNAVGLDAADSTIEAEDKINSLKDEEADQEISDTPPVAYDIYIADEKSNTLKESKLNNYIQIKNKEYFEKDFEKLYDFYPPIKTLESNYDKELVKDFFFKMYKLNETYKNTYNVNLDLPLLMATLRIQSTDMNEVFLSNLGQEHRKSTISRSTLKKYDYYYDWSKYKISRDNSEHDMEILAQHMVAVYDYSETNTCEAPVNGKCYKVDPIQYKEFLHEFLEKKYFLNSYEDSESDNNVENNGNENNNGNDDVNNNNPGNNDEGNNSENDNSTGSWRTWTQCGQSWSNIIIGDEPHETLCKIGCLVTSLSIQIARSGTYVVSDTFDPGVATKYFTFDSGGSLSSWDSIKNVSPYFERIARIQVFGWSRKHIAEKITSYDSKKYYFILNVGPTSKNYATHFVAVDYADKSTGNIYIIDPGYKNRDMVYDHYKVYRLYILEKKD